MDLEPRQMPDAELVRNLQMGLPGTVQQQQLLLRRGLGCCRPTALLGQMRAGRKLAGRKPALAVFLQIHYPSRTHSAVAVVVVVVVVVVAVVVVVVVVDAAVAAVAAVAVAVAAVSAQIQAVQTRAARRQASQTRPADRMAD